jgi:carboxyl-terminal processing protease
MHRRLALLSWLAAIFALGAAGCRPAPRIVTVQVTAEREVAVTATARPTAVASPAVEEQPTATIPPIRATLDAMAAAAQYAPADEQPATLIAADDYVALVDQGCRLVEENYVRDDFNGVDWPAVCQSYRQRAETISNQQEFWQLMREFMAELGDDHSHFLAPDQYAAQLGLPNRPEGIAWPGLTIWPAREDEHLVIWDVCQVGPAADAGLRRGDAVLAINGRPVTDPEIRLDVTGVSNLLYELGDSVTLTVQRGPGGQPEEVVIPFGGAAGCDGWYYDVLSREPYVGYIRVPSFDGIARTNIAEMLDLLEEERPLVGLVIDVRHNPGGNADRSLALFTTGIFGQLGPLREGATKTIYRIRGPVGWNETTPIVLLIDGASNSAAEYFATAMQQSQRATLVGMATAGNVEGWIAFNMADGSLLRMAYTTLILPDGSSLEGVGVQPDIEVPLGLWGLRQSPDVQLAEALRIILDLLNAN